MSDLIDREALLRQIDIDSEGEPGYYGDTWKFIDTIKSMPPAEHGTNLASLGTDLISRQAAIDALNEVVKDHSITDFDAIASILDLPPAQPEIIYCGECAKMQVDSIYHDCWCKETGKKVWVNHYCGYAERRTDGQI